MTVYLDVLFLLNVWLDYLLLMMTARFTGHYARRRRMLLAATIGGIYAILAFLFPLTQPLSFLCQSCCAAGMVHITFRRRDRLLRLWAMYLLLSAAFAGTVMALYQLWGGACIRNGVFYMDVTMGQIVLAVLVAVGMVTILLRRQGAHLSKKEIQSVSARWNQREIHFSALVDSGNDLRDPVTGKPAIVLEKQVFGRLLPEEYRFLIEEIGKSDVSELVERASALTQGSRFGLLACRSVGTASTLLLTLRPDAIHVGKRAMDALLAVAPSALSAGEYDALIGIDW